MGVILGLYHGWVFLSKRVPNSNSIGKNNRHKVSVDPKCSHELGKRMTKLIIVIRVRYQLIAQIIRVHIRQWLNRQEIPIQTKIRKQTHQRAEERIKIIVILLTVGRKLQKVNPLLFDSNLCPCLCHLKLVQNLIGVILPEEYSRYIRLITLNCFSLAVDKGDEQLDVLGVLDLPE